MILNALRERIATPSDVIATTGLPRYEVLAAFHVLEALDLVEVVYSRGNYKLYRLTKQGKELLEALEKDLEVVIEIKGIEREGADEAEEPSEILNSAATESVEVSAEAS